ncbi:pyridoxal phosphate-dependent class II aminotransferase [Rhizobium leguminosarum]|uniref:Aminotransferase n=1 Tax=Rhizobium johnstonii (strain DSM 114642 / LMG 32736 / 3841) TaxID=216596 RepID=Q1MFG2_RHIJ3|nr:MULTISPECIES: threonine-phosphate decarboxylase [Rhizobium]MBY5372199.1 pyridoxal phosphate-dependent class II aminotransferase [Rhizobium leguminosarum]NEI89333.1 aminotransferase class I/II-fold pyridoxal phosphate-dependent enzyme [Rhizobium leguminosarum]NEJ75208.1 aminotransferase class I/II-fold pyridoxal phosphate-dependent enzyme [Rhizobium leguminosarum]TBF40939.1 pyridoxal phosphate-dependent class II aminotransferase [Rhizobium leguminosarum]TBF52487.1 pyridoxal phosphate-depende
MSAPIVHGGGITAAAATFGGRPEDWLDLSTGINPCPVALPDISARAWHRLPDRHLVEAARRAARDHYGSGEILPLPVPGTQSVIQLLPRLVEGRLVDVTDDRVAVTDNRVAVTDNKVAVTDNKVAVVSPTYGEYARALTSAGFTVDAVDNVAAIGIEHRLAVVVNPNNPDGLAWPAETLIALHDRMKAAGGLLVVDEAFGDTDPALSLASRAQQLPNLIIFRSFGKFFGLAGLRLGFAIARDDILARFEDWLGPWAVSGPALSIAGSLLRSDVSPIRGRIDERSAGLHAVLKGAGLRMAGGTALFTLVADAKAGDIYTHLCRHHILVRKFDYAPDWLRFGLTPAPAADRRLSEALQRFER